MKMNRRKLRASFFHLDNQFKSHRHSGFWDEVPWVPFEKLDHFILRDSPLELASQLEAIAKFPHFDKLIFPCSEEALKLFPEGKFYRLVQTVNPEYQLDKKTRECVFISSFVSEDESAYRAFVRFLQEHKSHWVGDEVQKIVVHFTICEDIENDHISPLLAKYLKALEPLTAGKDLQFLDDVYDHSPFLQDAVVLDFTSEYYAFDSSYWYHAKYMAAVLPQIPVVKDNSEFTWSILKDMGIQVFHNRDSIKDLYEIR